MRDLAAQVRGTPHSMPESAEIARFRWGMRRVSDLISPTQWDESAALGDVVQLLQCRSAHLQAPRQAAVSGKFGPSCHETARFNNFQGPHNHRSVTLNAKWHDFLALDGTGRGGSMDAVERSVDGRPRYGEYFRQIANGIVARACMRQSSFAAFRRAWAACPATCPARSMASFTRTQQPDPPRTPPRWPGC